MSSPWARARSRALSSACASWSRPTTADHGRPPAGGGERGLADAAAEVEQRGPPGRGPQAVQQHRGHGRQLGQPQRVLVG
ncbi:MAG: hypothetical protein FWD42_05640 [Solirubrobacterales bacterium]|nr:hypothetical protein [Solirubrobacterales bacterium]